MNVLFITSCSLWIAQGLPGMGGGGSGGGFSGMAGYMGLMAPIMIIGMAFKKKGPATHFIKAGATSPETARKPRSVEVDNLDLLDGPIRRGVLVSTGDGRFWVDLAAHRKWRRIVIAGAIVLAAALAAACVAFILK